MLHRNDYSGCLSHINQYWKRITCFEPHDYGTHLGLPNKFVSPNDKTIFRKDQFYWDTYFTILGLVVSGKVALAKGMIDNFCYLFDRFGIIPMRNRYYNLGTSQIPFLTSMILEVFAHDKDTKWLKKTISVAELELKNYWMNDKMTEKHMVHKGLSRYADHYLTHLGAEHESGWDMTSRFNNHCLFYLPVDLNACLYKYETDLSSIFGLMRNPAKRLKYDKQAEKRKKIMHELMWNEKKKFYFDYNQNTKQRSRFYSVAGFYPLWASMATPEQAQAIVEHTLPLFEKDGGIVNTQANGISKDLKQHDYPNGWPGQQWIVIKGLLNYGYHEAAERIARKWLDLNANLLSLTGEMWEKYDVVNSKVGVFNPDRYRTQSGFGWTNAVFVRLVHDFSK